MAKSTDIYKSVIGQAIRTARKVRGVTQDELAEAVGFSKAAVSSWESGRTTPRAEVLDKIADVLDTPVECLYDGRGSVSYAHMVYQPAPDPVEEDDLAEIVRVYNSLNDEGKKYLRECAEFARQREMFRR